MRNHAVLLLAACSTAACIEPTGTEQLKLGSVSRDCVVPRPNALAGWGAPVAVELDEASLWIWPRVEIQTSERISSVHSVSAVVSDMDRTCDVGVDLVMDTDGAPLQVLQLRPDEIDANATRNDGRRISLRATGGFAHAGRAYLYYDKLLEGPDLFEETRIGTGLCIIDDAEQSGPCRRIEPQVVPNEPTLLWGPLGRGDLQSGLVAPDGYAYLYGCHHAAAFVDLCSVSRVRPEQARDPAAYSHYSWVHGWLDDPSDVTVLFEAPSAITVAASPHSDGYQAIVANIWDSRFEIHAAREPWGSFHSSLPLFDAVGPEEWFIDGGREHTALRGGDRDLVLSYHTTSTTSPGLHLVGYRFISDPLVLERQQ